MGNPFQEQSSDLLILDTHDIVDSRVAETIRSVIETLGKEQYRQFVTEVLELKSKSLYIPIKQNKLPLFSRQQTKANTKEKQQIMSETELLLFSQLYVSCQVRNGSNLGELFRHENQSYPPSHSFSSIGKVERKMRESSKCRCFIIDRGAIINMLNPCGSRIFKDYFKYVFFAVYIRSLTIC